MKCCPDSSGGGDDPRPPPPAATGVGGSPEPPSGEPSKKQRTEEPSPSSSVAVAGECSSSSTQPPLLPQDATVGEPAPPPPPGSESGGGGEEEQARVPDLGEDLLFEVLMRAEARTLARAACASRAWRALARDERLWEAACVRDCASTGYSEQRLRKLVLSHGGFRRLYEMFIRPAQRRRARQLQPARMGQDQLQVSLGLLSTAFFLNMPNAPPPPPKDKDGKDGDKNGGGQCG